MKKIKRTFFIEEKGLTLVEVLASFVILSIALVIFLSIFIQSAKTNQTSKEIIDATYIAQTEMEIIYEKSRKNLPFDDESYEKQENDEGWEVYHKPDLDSEYLIKVKTKPLEDDDKMIRVVVEVVERIGTDSEIPIAQMENLLKWGADNEE